MLNVINNDASNTSLRGLCHGCLPHFVNITNYRIYSIKRRSSDVIKIKRR